MLRRDELPSASARAAPAAPVPGRGGGPGGCHGVDRGGLGARPQLGRAVMVVVVVVVVGRKRRSRRRRRSSRVQCSVVVSHGLLVEHLLLRHVSAHSLRIIEKSVVLVCLVDLRGGKRCVGGDLGVSS